jgi:hypothetical protein
MRHSAIRLKGIDVKRDEDINETIVRLKFRNGTNKNVYVGFGIFDGTPIQDVAAQFKTVSESILIYHKQYKNRNTKNAETEDKS